jgi:predicted acyltransferase
MTLEDTKRTTGPQSAAVSAADRQPAAPKPDRLRSLDVFRGITLVAMVFVNSHGGGHEFIYPGIDHGHWNNWGFADLVFPFFIFIVGVAVPYALSSRLARGVSEKKLWGHIFQRFLILFAIGLLMAPFPHYDLASLSKIRYLGVLQRLAICYLVASWLYLRFRPMTQAIIAAALLVFYFVVMKFVPGPGFGAGELQAPGSNWAQYIDCRLMTGHMQFKNLETKGLLSTLPAIATALIGVLTGQHLKSNAAPLEKAVNLYLFGTAGVFLGAVWSISFPINQAIWSSSLVLLMGGMSLIVLASCYYTVDIRKSIWWTPPFLVFGTNAVAVWIGSMLSRQTLEAIRVSASDGKLVDLKTYLYQFLAAWVGPWNGSLLFAVTFVLVWLGITSALYRRKVFIKI